MSNDVAHSSCLKPIALPLWLAASSCCKRYSLTSYGLGMKSVYRRTTVQLAERSVLCTSRYQEATHRYQLLSTRNIQQVGYGVHCRNNNGYDWTDIFWIDPRVKVNGQNYCDVLLSQQMLPAIKRVAERCLFTKQYVAYSEICHFLCFVIPQGKVVALDRWGGKWNHLSMTSRLTTDYAKNYCNRTLIVKVIVENVVTCFLWDTV